MIKTRFTDLSASNTRSCRAACMGRARRIGRGRRQCRRARDDHGADAANAGRPDERDRALPRMTDKVFGVNLTILRRSSRRLTRNTARPSSRPASRWSRPPATSRRSTSPSSRSTASRSCTNAPASATRCRRNAWGSMRSRSTVLSAPHPGEDDTPGLILIRRRRQGKNPDHRLRRFWRRPRPGRRTRARRRRHQHGHALHVHRKARSISW